MLSTVCLRMKMELKPAHARRLARKFTFPLRLIYVLGSGCWRLRNEIQYRELSVGVKQY